MIPSSEWAIVFVPCPTATQRVPFHAIPTPKLVKELAEPGIPVQVIPSGE